MRRGRRSCSLLTDTVSGFTPIPTVRAGPCGDRDTLQEGGEEVPTLSQPSPTLSQPSPTLSQPSPSLCHSSPNPLAPFPTLSHAPPTLSQPSLRRHKLPTL